MWLRGTVHINKWVSLLCICLYIHYDGFRKKRAMHFLWQSCQTPSSNKKQYIMRLFTSHSQQHSKILSLWINHRICVWHADGAALRSASEQTWQIARHVPSKEDDGTGPSKNQLKQGEIYDSQRRVRSSCLSCAYAYARWSTKCWN